MTDYREQKDREREAHVAALAAWREIASSPTFTAKQETAFRIKQARQELCDRRMVIYFLQESGTGAIKIGTSANVGDRARALECNMPYTLTLLATTPGGHRIEGLIQKLFAHARIRGEWFRPVPELLEYVAEIKSGERSHDQSQLLRELARW